MAAAKKSTKKTAAKKSTRKAPAKKSTAKKSTAKKSAKKSTAKKSAKKSTAKKSAAKKSTARSGSSSDVQLVVASRIKEAARAGDVRVAGDFADAFNAEVNEVLSKAIDRAKTNGRSTVRPGDL